MASGGKGEMREGARGAIEVLEVTSPGVSSATNYLNVEKRDWCCLTIGR